MRSRKWFIPALLPLLLTSCGDGSIVGTYKFQLGKDNDTHVALRMNLTNEDYKNASTGLTMGKTFQLNFDMQGKASSSSSAAESTTEESSAAFVVSGENTNVNFQGYYYPVANSPEIRLGTTAIIGQGFPTLNLDPELVEKVLYSYIDNDTLTVVVPVSMEDLAYQIYWYGYRIDLNNFTFTELDAKHEIGTHPSETDIAEIQTTEKKRTEEEHLTEENIFEEYRDFHQLSMGLIKE